jgi:hypothetical protein
MKLKFLLIIGCLCLMVSAQNAAKITLIQGKAGIQKKNSNEKRVAKVSMPLQVGDILSTGTETLVEITYNNGEIARIGDKTEFTIVTATDKLVQTQVPLGKVWVNMKKLTSQGREFEMVSPTATAAIRGTVFNMAASGDSSATVSVYNGRVAVGLTGTPNDKTNERDINVHEVPGPSEVPGPYEVSMTQWLVIVAGQQITVRADKKYASQAFDTTTQSDLFTKMNLELDKKPFPGKN